MTPNRIACNVCISTSNIVVRLAPAGYERLKEMLPAEVGHRSWYVQEQDCGVMVRRTQFGTSSRRTAYGVEIENEAGTIVRSTWMPATLELRHREVFARLPAYHLRPWIKDSRARLRETPIEKWRWHLVQEINARIRSATQHAEDFPFDSAPQWVHQMLTPVEHLHCYENRELVH